MVMRTTKSNTDAMASTGIARSQTPKPQLTLMPLGRGQHCSSIWPHSTLALMSLVCARPQHMEEKRVKTQGKLNVQAS